MSTMTPDPASSLTAQYHVERVGGTPHKHDACAYLVLDPLHDPKAEAAIRHYADLIRDRHRDLAADLDAWMDRLPVAHNHAPDEGLGTLCPERPGQYGQVGACRSEVFTTLLPDGPCPTCSGPSRQTVGMVCQTCGTDYGAEPESVTSLVELTDMLREQASVLTVMQDCAHALRRVPSPHPDWSLDLVVAADRIGQAWVLLRRALGDVEGLIAVTSPEAAAREVRVP